MWYEKFLATQVVVQQDEFTIQQTKKFLHKAVFEYTLHILSEVYEQQNPLVCGQDVSCLQNE